MRSLRYLNQVLTVLALLLTLHLWVQWNNGPAATLDLTQEAHAQGLANAGQQRKEIVDQMKLLNTQVSQLRAMLAGGEIRVRVQAAAEEPPVAPPQR